MTIVNREMKYEYSPEIYLSLHQAWSGGFIVATMYGKVVGFIMCGVTPDRSVRILLLVVKKEMQSQGIGKRLMDIIIEKARFRGINKISLEVRVGNRQALTFYKRYGMRIIGKVKGFYKNGEDALVLELILGS